MKNESKKAEDRTDESRRLRDEERSKDAPPITTTTNHKL